MKEVFFLLLAACIIPLGCSTNPTGASNADSAYIVAQWHMDEISRDTVYDSSRYQNDGFAIGTTITDGKFGKARSFNGNGDYIYVPDPINGSIDFGQDQSFTVDLWFRTTSDALQDIIRKGSAPIPGYFIQTEGGKVNAGVGADVSSPPPDTILVIESNLQYNDGKWHEVRFVRDC
jgi:hypothetical protein